MNKKCRKDKLNGSVLYTVVAVMMIMTVFIFAAYSLAAAANRRAYNSYANNQTQYTARSVVETVWDQIESNPELAKQITNLTGSKNFKVTLPDKSMGEVKNATVTYLGKGTDYGYDIDDSFYKLSVTVKMLGQENTLAGYFLPEKIENPSFDYALVSLDSGSMDNAAIYGGASYGVVSYGENKAINNTILRSPVNVNGDLTVEKPGDVYIEQNSGIFVNGDLSFRSSNGNVNSVISATPLKYRELPYLYVDKKINYSSTDITIGSDNSPVIVMADSIQQTAVNNFPIYGDVYLYDTSTASNLGNGCEIKKAADNTNILQKQDNALVGFSSDTSYKCGNLYSLGEINSYREGALANNIVAKTLNLNANTSTSGAVVAENVNISGGSDFNFKNGLFVDPDKFSGDNDSSNNKSYVINNQTYIAPEIKKVYQTVSSELIDEMNPKVSDEAYQLYYRYENTILKLDSFDFSDKLSNPTDVISVKPTITLNVSKLEDYYYYDNANFKVIYPDGTEIDNRLNLSGITTIELEEINANASEIYYCIEPSKDGWEDWSRSIYINSVSITYNVSVNRYAYDEIINKTDNTQFLRDVNDVAFDNNGNTIYIDDIDKSVKIEKFVDYYGYTKLRISKADLTGIEEGKELESSVSYTEIGTYDYYAGYADFLRKVVETVTFPESMKKENVKGGFVDDNFLKTIPETGKSEIEDYAEREVINAFGHINETENMIYDFWTNTVTDKDGNKLEDITFPLTITTSCTLKHGLSGQSIYIAPSSDNIYIKLEDFGIYNMQGQDAIIVNDDDGKKKVNFLVPKGYDVSITGNLLTEYYKNNTAIIQNPIKNDDTDPTKKVVDQQKIPGVSFYMEYDESNMHTISFPNSAKVSAYILAPSGKFSLLSSGTKIPYTYNGINCSSECSNASIGAIVCKSVELENFTIFAYVNPNPKLDDDSEEELHYETRCIYYQAY